MRTPELPHVAILLATYNGERFIEQQLRSLTENQTPFTLHWIDDHSGDGTRELVRRLCASVGIPLTEWHQTERQGVPGTFFQLLDCVEADIYLFCDQDDIWQAGKIDATVACLVSDLEKPVLCLSDPLAFHDGSPETHYRTLDILRTTPEVALQESRAFMSVVGYGHTEGFTRPLRDLYLKHKSIARSHALMHDLWMYDIALASGSVRLLSNAPTTLYRWHRTNASEAASSWRGNGIGRVTMTWKQHQWLRRRLAQNARGFLKAAPTLPPGANMERLLASAQLVSKLDQRHSLISAFRLLRRRVLWPNLRLAAGLAAVCLWSNASV